MGQVLRMPSQAELPRGARRDFTESLFSLYREARRPGLREISSAIPDDAPGTASTETIRRMLRGKTVPVNWQTVAAVVTALCHLAEVDPDDSVGDYRDYTTRRELVEGAWHRALDEPIRRAAPEAPVEDDPWASDLTEINGYKVRDEPPF